MCKGKRTSTYIHVERFSLSSAVSVPERLGLYPPHPYDTAVPVTYVCRSAHAAVDSSCLDDDARAGNIIR